MTASFGIPAGKSLCPLKTIKLNLAPLRCWFMAVDALSNLFYSAARSMHLTEWGLLHCLYCSMDDFFLLYYWIYMSHILLIAREPWNFFYLTPFTRQIFFQFLFLLASLLIFRSNYTNACSPNELFERCRKLITISFFPEWILRLHILSVVLILLRSLFRLCEEQPVSAMKQWPVNSGMFETLLVNVLKSNWLTSALVDGVTSTLTILKAT